MVGGPEGCDSAPSCSGDRAEALLSRALSEVERPCGTAPSVRACLFSSGICASACMAVSDMADASEAGPVTTVCDGRIPGWVDADTDAVMVSYGIPGDVGLYAALSERGCGIHCITDDAALSERCRADGGESIVLEDGLDSSEAVMSALGALCALVSSMGLMDAATELREAVDSIRSEAVSGDIPGIGPDDVFGVYSTTDVRACSRRWADLIIERKGRLAFCGELPEYDHNELVGWSDPNPHAEQLRMLVLRSEYDGSMPAIIVGHMLEVLSENGRDVTVIGIGAGSPLTRDIRGFIEGDLAVGRRERCPISL